MNGENTQNSIEERRALREKESRENKLKLIMGALVLVIVALAAALFFISRSHSKVVSELNLDKEELTAQMVQLRSEYDSLSTSNAFISSQLDSSKEQVSQLIERIKKTDASNRARMRQYEKELGTLRSIMKHYVYQIDSLNTLNKKLKADAASARRETAQVKKENEQMSQQISDLSGKVATGSALKARALRLEAQNSAGKVVDRAKSTERFLTSLSLVANDLAKKGWTRIYIIVKDPAGAVVFPSSNPSGESFVCAGESLVASASREVDYQGAEIDMSIYLNDIASFEKGIYTVEVFSEASSLGTAEVMLR